MLYLLKSFTISKKTTLLKLGFSDALETRLMNYYHHNPAIELLSVRNGDIILESLMHLYLKKHARRYNGLNEWYYDDPIIRSIFHISQYKLERLIWKNRDYYLDLDNNLQLYLYLLYKNKTSFSPEKYSIILDGYGRKKVKINKNIETLTEYLKSLIHLNIKKSFLIPSIIL